ncbi:IS481 family transposase [Nocardia brasiliensis]|uniref:IS481 family transposase n=1 Tax=Nocardia brasiliensis TaxID=37326 RepID=UPI0024552644|nr:IS481 family transposase [Nocardia brasiliensis]
MEQRLAAVFAEVAAGRATVVGVCAELGISRDRFYVYRRRFAEEGLAGLVPRSRAPKSSPTRTGELMTGLIVAARKELEREGWDNGGLSIRARLLHDGVLDAPCARTIHRVLVRAGMVEPEPRKRPRATYRRFVFPATDDCWHIDAFEHTLADNAATVVVIFQLTDDHSRYELTDLAWPREDTEGAWRCVSTAIERYGQPRMILSDNGLSFTGKHIGIMVSFERNLARLGIKLITTAPRHPQTNGKNERAHRTLRQWLTAQPPATSIRELQTLLDDYRPLYNTRPHQALHGTTPDQTRLTGGRHTPHTTLATPYLLARDATVTSRGLVNITGAAIPIGTEYAGRKVTAFVRDDDVLIFYREQLVRELTLDRTRRRQNPIRPRRGPHPPTLNYNP